jgi:PIN domain nuclease of toxin-antitoxin system
MKYVLDTHALIWFIEGNSRLGQNAFAVLSNASSVLMLPAIALAEAVWIIDHGKTSIPSAEMFLNAIDRDSRITIYPLDRAVINATLTLSEIHEMHDRQIVARACC